jgi:MFS family permease
MLLGSPNRRSAVVDVSKPLLAEPTGEQVPEDAEKVPQNTEPTGEQVPEDVEKVPQNPETSVASTSTDDSDVAAVATVAGSLLFCVEINEGMLGTFFFSWALQKGLTFAEVGYAFGCMSIGMICLAPLAPYLILKFGPAKVQYYASWAFVVVRSGFMILPITPVVMIYTTMCALYFCMGCVSVLSESAASAWTLTSVTPDKRTQAMGILLGTRSAAQLVAPALGGTLYDMGGFFLPITAGALIFAVTLVIRRKKILVEAPPVNTLATKVGSILRSKHVCVCQVINFIVLFSLSSCGVFFQTYLLFNYGLPSWKYGLMMSAFSLIFIFGALFAARMERACGTKLPLLVGSLVMSMSLLLFGPSPYLTFLPAPGPSSIWLPALSLAGYFFGMSQTMSILSPMVLRYATREGWSEDDAAAQNGMLNIVSGGCAVGIGAACGGSLVQSVGVPATTSCFAVVMPTLVAGGLAILALWDRGRDSHQDGNSPTTTV